MYREFAPGPTLSSLVQCLWQHSGGSASIVPDGCLDLMWNGRTLLVAGPDTKPIREHSDGPMYGLRFRTGVAPAVLGVPASALRDARVELHELWGDRALHLRDAVLREGPGAMRSAIDLRVKPDALVLELVQRLRMQPELRVPLLASELGVSERQLNRRVTSAVGYGPKLLARILRMQSFVAALSQLPDESLASLAMRLGFADQAHLSHEASALRASTPRSLKARHSPRG